MTASHIVVGYDGSTDAQAALDFAVNEAIGLNADLKVVYAVDDTVLNSAWGIVFDVDEVRSMGHDIVSDARTRAIEAGLPAERLETSVVVGQPAAVLSTESEKATLMVCGRRSSSGSEGMFVGSTSVAAASALGAPMVVVSGENVKPEKPFGVIAVGVDSAGDGGSAIGWAIARAKRLGASVRIISGVRRGGLFARQPTEAQKEKALAEARARVEAAARPHLEAAPEVPVTFEVSYGDAVPGLLAISREVDMLMLGTRVAFPSFGVGGIVRALMAHAHCPLGILRHP